jgi:hypothetical protein
MRKLFLILLLLPIIATAQTDSIKYLKDTIVVTQLPIDSSGTVLFKFIQEIPNVKKSDLYSRAKVWTAIAFRSAKNVIQFDDDEKNSLIVKGIEDNGYCIVRFYIHFTFKDNKYRVIISQLSIDEDHISTYPAINRTTITYYPDTEYKEIKEWNFNVKMGNMEFNRQNGLSKREIKDRVHRINIVGSFGLRTIADIKQNMLKTTKGDDF